MAERQWGQKGGPWEFNLRDLFRWCQLMLVDQAPGCYDPGQHVFLVYGERMRTREDKEKVSHFSPSFLFRWSGSIYRNTSIDFQFQDALQFIHRHLSRKKRKIGLFGVLRFDIDISASLAVCNTNLISIKADS